MVRKSWFLWLIMVLFVAGCSGSGSSSELEISPDGAKAAFVYSDMINLPLPPEVPVIRSVTYVAWVDLDRPDEVNSVKMETRNWKTSPWEYQYVHPLFSPDNAWLAVAAPSGMFVIELETSRKVLLSKPGEEITSLAWLNANEVGYVAQTETERIFRRQRVDGGESPRTTVFTECSPDLGRYHRTFGQMGWPGESWSPDGRLVMFRPRSQENDLRIVDTATGEVQSLNKPCIGDAHAAWAGNGTMVFVTCSDNDPQLNQALVYDPATEKLIDLTEPFYQYFYDSYFQLAPTWTWDDQYVVVNDAKRGGCLVRPEPWQVIPLYQKAVDRLNRSETDAADSGPAGAYNGFPALRVQPVTGWMTTVIGRPGPKYGPAGYENQSYLFRDYAVSSDGSLVEDLGRSCPNCLGVFFLPDGKRLAAIEYGAKRVIVRPLNLPPLDQ